jgi:RNA polymerase-binding transcription factor DksA
MKAVSDRKAQLEARLADLEARLMKIEDELDGPHTRDWEDLATEREGDEVLEELGLSGQQEIAMIRAALARINAGEYGACTKCGTEIVESRLDVLPYTPFCYECAS